MKDMMTILLAGIEDVAKNMKEYVRTNPVGNHKYSELEQKIEKLTERVDRLVDLMEHKLGKNLAAEKQRGKRMMDIKQRINDVIAKYPDGIRPPQIAQIIGTRVQNLYPHLKSAVEGKLLRKNDSGAYTLTAGKKKK